MAFSKQQNEPIEVQGFIESHRKQTTVSATKCHLKILNKFSTQKEDMREIHTIYVTELDRKSKFYQRWV